MSRLPVISLTISGQQSRQLQAELAGVRNGFPRVLSGAQNKTIKTGESRIVKDLAKIINLQQGSPNAERRDTARVGSQKYIRDYISIRRATYEKLEAQIRFRRKGIPLYAYKAVQRAMGVSVKPRKDRPAQLLRHTFIADMRSGHRGIFERRIFPTKQTRREKRVRNGRAYWTELPIDERYGPTVLGVYEGSPGLAQMIETDIHSIYHKNIASQVDRVLDRKRAENA